MRGLILCICYVYTIELDVWYRSVYQNTFARLSIVIHTVTMCSPYNLVQTILWWVWLQHRLYCRSKITTHTHSNLWVLWKIGSLLLLNLKLLTFYAHVEYTSCAAFRVADMNSTAYNVMSHDPHSSIDGTQNKSQKLPINAYNYRVALEESWWCPLFFSCGSMIHTIYRSRGNFRCSILCWHLFFQYGSIRGWQHRWL